MDHAATTASSGVALGSGKLVDLGRGELAGGDTVFEENVEFTVGAALGLGETEVGPDDADARGAEPQVARLRSPVPESVSPTTTTAGQSRTLTKQKGSTCKGSRTQRPHRRRCTGYEQGRQSWSGDGSSPSRRPASSTQGRQ